MRLLRTQKNVLFKIIESFQDLSPNQFSFENIELSDRDAVSIRFSNSEFQFLIFEDLQYSNTFYANYIPGFDVYQGISERTDWLSIVSYFEKWLSNISREIEEPDYWDRFNNEIGDANFAIDSENSRFSVREFEDLQIKMNLISENVKSIPIILDQQNIIIQELERITDLAKDLGKFDWKNLLIGSIANLIFQFGITKENAALIYDLIKTTLKTYFLN